MADEVKIWVKKYDLGKYGELFTENEIDLGTLPLLSEADLKELGLPLGARRKLQAAIAQLSRPEPQSSPSTPASPTPYWRKKLLKHLGTEAWRLPGRSPLACWL